MKTLAFIFAMAASSWTMAKDLFTGESHPDAICLAKNIYFEARSSNFADKVAVADVVLNRVKDRRYPDTICGVVKDAKMSKWWKEHHNKDVPIRHKCQFSWFCDGKSDIPTEQDSWMEAQRIAYFMLYLGEYVGITEGATHYHAHYVNPRWNRDMYLIGTIGDHIYYRRN